MMYALLHTSAYFQPHRLSLLGPLYHQHKGSVKRELSVFPHLYLHEQSEHMLEMGMTDERALPAVNRALWLARGSAAHQL